MRVYLDSSALIKRALLEDESSSLIAAIERYVDASATLLSSTLSWVEVSGSLRSRLDSEPPAEVADRINVALSGIVECPISDEIIGVACRLGGPSTLRSLDAIHLATATLIGADLVCAYDKRLLTSAPESGFRRFRPASRPRPGD